MSDGATVFIVDDDPAARASLAALVSAIGLKTDVYGSAAEFLAAFDRTQPGCLVTDVRMLEMTGLELQERLASDHCPLPVIIISAYADAPMAVQALRKGAVTLLEKPCPDHELRGAIREAIELDAARRRSVAEWNEFKRRQASLTPDELRVMELIVAGKANKVIARELDIGLRTAEARRHHVFEKMGCDAVADLVRIALVLEKPPF